MHSGNSSRLLLFSRRLWTSTTNYVRFPYSINSSTVREIGRVLPSIPNDVYKPGQLFIHRTFAYKGVVVCAFNTRFHEKSESNLEKQSEMRDYYQVLIHRGDWPFMTFPVDLTTYLQDGQTRGEKLFAMINGMDCVSHTDIIPITSTEKTPMEHDLFDRIFTKDDSVDGSRISLRPTLLENYMASQKTWLSPRDVYRETTDSIEVTVTTFYLGVNNIAGQQRHAWRYVIRLENHAPHNAVILRERSLKIYSLNNMNQANGHGVIGKQPELNFHTPAFQFSSTIELPHAKGGHMWGSFKMERENGSTFNVTIPTVVLESFDTRPADDTSKSSE